MTTPERYAFVRVCVRRFYDVRLDGVTDWYEARLRADAVDLTALEPAAQDVAPSVRYIADAPRLRAAARGRQHVLIFGAASGAAFDQATVRACVDACERVYFEIVDTWNGVGCDTFSVAVRECPEVLDQRLKVVHHLIEHLTVPPARAFSLEPSPPRQPELNPFLAALVAAARRRRP